MAYLPGPLILQDAANVGISTTNYDFTDFTIDSLSDFDVTVSSWDAFIDDATLLLDEPEDPYPDFDIPGAMDALNTYNDPVSLFGVDDLLTAMGVASVSLSGAIGAAPAEAWQDPTAPFVAPGAVEQIAVPIIPFGALEVTVSGATGAPPPLLVPPPAAIPSGVILTNLTAYGSGNYTVGDTGQITATGVAGSTIYVQATLNGEDLGSTYVGSIGDDGTFTSMFTEGPDAIGTWTQEWFIGGRNVAAFNFVVFDSE